MSVFLDIKSLKLRATYSTDVAEATINDVVMNVAIDGPIQGAARAKSVEICDCPIRATGSSCEVSPKSCDYHTRKTLELSWQECLRWLVITSNIFHHLYFNPLTPKSAKKKSKMFKKFNY